MFTLFFYHKNFMLAVFSLLLCSIICQILLGVIYHRLIHETENMSATKNKSLQQLKLKFTSCSQLHNSMPNIAVFVDKYLNQISIGKISVTFLKHLSGQLTLLSVLVAGIGACRGIIREESFLMIAPFYLVSLFGLYLYFAVTSLIDVPGKVNVLRTNLIDYLENHLSSRLHQTQLDMRLVGMEDVPLKDAPLKEEELFPKQNDHKNNTPAFTPSEAEELELLLQEFLA